MKTTNAFAYVGFGMLVGGIMTSCMPPNHPEQLSGDTVKIDFGPGRSYGYLQEIQLPSGTRCVTFASQRGGEIACDFPVFHNTGASPPPPIER